MTTLQEENIEGYAGDTISVDLGLFDDEDVKMLEAPLIGATAVIEVRNRLFGDVVHTSTGTVTPADATISFTIPALESAALLAAPLRQVVLVYGVQLTFSDGSLVTLVSGKLKIVRGVNT